MRDAWIGDEHNQSCGIIFFGKQRYLQIQPKFEQVKRALWLVEISRHIHPFSVRSLFIKSPVAHLFLYSTVLYVEYRKGSDLNLIVSKMQIASLWHIVLVFSAWVFGLEFLVVNKCMEQTIWPALTGNTSANPASDPLPSGAILHPGESIKTRPIVTPWSGRIWARQFCALDGSGCLLGDCGSSSCWGRSSVRTTLFEVTAGHYETIYDISLGMYLP